MSSQLSYSKHVEALSSKAKARAGQIFPQLRLKRLPLHVVLRVIQIYILPIREYGLPTWVCGTLSEEAKAQVNSTLTNYLKRYLGVPTESSNTLTHFICQTTPLFNFLLNVARDRFYSISLPHSLSVAKLCLVNHIPQTSAQSSNCFLVWQNDPKHTHEPILQKESLSRNI